MVRVAADEMSSLRPERFFGDMTTARAGRRRLLAGLGAALAALALTAPVRAETAEEKGLAIAREADRRGRGWASSIVKAKMLLRDREGSTAERLLEMRSLESRRDGEDGGKALMIFRSPPDVDGTLLLTHSFKTRDDDQWIFLPEIQRVKRISSSNKSGSFLGSEFTYEDLRDAQIEKYRFRYLRDENCGEERCFVVERVSNDPDSSYSRQAVWIDQREYRTHKVEYYDRRGYGIKTLTIGDHRRYLNEFWRAHHLVMRNNQTGKSTEMLWGEYRFRQNLTDRDFDRNALSWIR
jgi:hypothetical protein